MRILVVYYILLHGIHYNYILSEAATRSYHAEMLLGAKENLGLVVFKFTAIAERLRVLSDCNQGGYVDLFVHI